jgi:hypothetical protein
MTLVGQTQGVCKAMEGSLFYMKIFETYKQIKQGFLSSNHISVFNNLTIMCSVRYDSQV